MVPGSNPGWAGPSPSCHLILVCVNYDQNGSLRINSKLHASLNNQIFHPIHPTECNVKLYIWYVKGKRIISLPDLGHTMLNFVNNDKSLPFLEIRHWIQWDEGSLNYDLCHIKWVTLFPSFSYSPLI